MEEQYDNILLGILSNEGKIDKFLNAVFGFLHRRTDFYKIMSGPKDKMGFPAGVSEKIVNAVFQYYARMSGHPQPTSKVVKQKVADTATALACRSVKDAPAAPGGSDTDKAAAPASDVPITPLPVEQVDVVSQDATPKSNPARESVSADPSASVPCTDTSTPNSTTARVDPVPMVVVPKPVCASNDPQPETSAPEPPSATKPEQQPQSHGTEKKTDDSGEKVYTADPECYNGSIRDVYRWSQWISEADMRLDVPKNIARGKQVKVEVTRKHISVQYANEQGGWTPLLDKELCWEVRRDECMWTLVPREHIHIHLEKVQERWWESVFVGEEPINIRKIDCSRPITDLDGEAQGKVSQMMYDEQQKRLGKPTSEQQKASDMLKGAWNAEGSPFRGTDFDPSKISIGGDGSFNIAQ